MLRVLIVSFASSIVIIDYLYLLILNDSNIKIITVTFIVIFYSHLFFRWYLIHMYVKGQIIYSDSHYSANEAIYIVNWNKPTPTTMADVATQLLALIKTYEVISNLDECALYWSTHSNIQTSHLKSRLMKINVQVKVVIGCSYKYAKILEAFIIHSNNYLEKSSCWKDFNAIREDSKERL